MTEEQIREIIRSELSYLIRTDRYTFHKLLQFMEGQNIQMGTGTGTKIGTAATQKLGIWGATPIPQPSSVGEVNGFTAGSGAATKVDSAYTGNSGSTAYTISDIVKHLKTIGLIAS